MFAKFMDNFLMVGGDCLAETILRWWVILIILNVVLILRPKSGSSDLFVFLLMVVQLFLFLF